MVRDSGAVWNVGYQLGRVCAGFMCENVESFMAMLRVRGHPLWLVVEVVNAAAIDSRRVFVLEDIRRVLVRRGALDRGRKALLRAAFGLYCTMRARARPRGSQPRR